METQRPTLSAASRQIEALLDSNEKNSLTDFVRQQSMHKVEAAGTVPSNYDVFAVRRNEQIGDDVFGPKQLLVGTYSEDVLYGAAGSPVLRFRSAIQVLKERADSAASIGIDELEYGHQTALFWAEVGRLKDFIGSSPVITEIVAELRTARFQFVGKDTPRRTIAAIASALGLVTEAKRFDGSLVDHVVEALEEGGIDPLAPDVLRASNV